MKKLSIAVCILAMSSDFVFAKTVSSLSEVRGQIKSKEIRTMYDEQMDGIAKKDGFSSLVRNDSNVNAVLAVIGHHADSNNLGLLGLKQWQNNQYIVVACSYTKPVKLTYVEQKNRYAECGSFSNPIDTITVALVTKNSQGQWQLLAKPYIEHPQTIPDSNKSNSAFTLASRDEADVIGNLDRLDLANYQLNDSTKAFGIRYSTNVGYAGGGASSQAMTLFTVMNGQLKPVLSMPTYEYENIAGEWHKDGTRDHDISTREYILKMLPQQKNGFHSILWQEKSAKKPQQRVYIWNSQSQHYE